MDNHIMKKNFNIDSPRMEFLEKVTDIVYVSFLWVLFSIPVITIGPASVALYYTVVKVIRHKRETIWKSFFHAFRQNLKQGCFFTVWYGVIFTFFILLVKLLMVERFQEIYLISGSILLFYSWFTLPYIFPVLSRYDAPIIKQFQYSVIMSLDHVPTTLLLISMLALAILLTLLVPILLAVLPGLYAMASSFLIERVFKKYRKKNSIKEQGDLPWYQE